MIKNSLSFCTIPELHGKNAESVSPLGQLNGQTRNYAKFPRWYQSNPSGLALANFYAKDEKLEDVEINKASFDKQLEICLWMLDAAKKKHFTSNADNCLQQIRAQFTKDIEFTDIGEMVTNSVIYLPSFLKFNLKEGNDTVEGCIWFANAYFETGYPYREIEVVLPVPDEEIDFLYEHNYLEVRERLLTETPPVIEQRVKVLTNNDKTPPSWRDAYMYLLHDTVNGVTTPTYFQVLIWGNPNDADDEILEAKAKAILKHSKYSETEWTPKYPDIFSPLEFFCITHFEQLGLVNKTSETSTFSPIHDYETALKLPKLYGNLTKESDLIKSLQTLPFMYKSALVDFVGKLENYGGIKKVGEIYKDYQLVELGDRDAGRIEPETLNFIKQMETLISAAEVSTPTGLPVAGTKRVYRNGKFYISRRIGKVNFIMATRYQFIEDGIIDD